MNDFKDKDLWDELGAYKARVEVAEVRAESAEHDRDEWKKRFVEMADHVKDYGRCGVCPWCPEDLYDCDAARVVCKARILAHYGVEEETVEKPCIECQARPDLCHEHPKQGAADGKGN